MCTCPLHFSFEIDASLHSHPVLGWVMPVRYCSFFPFYLWLINAKKAVFYSFLMQKCIGQTKCKNCFYHIHFAVVSVCLIVSFYNLQCHSELWYTWHVILLLNEFIILGCFFPELAAYFAVKMTARFLIYWFRGKDSQWWGISFDRIMRASLMMEFK